ncbi:MAG: PEP-CTERM sorting domain-containing protein [Planctomycetes bacterium]|nr:PEP-CTERM sorting domain-containing protein [Planctomycetota bacterium]
MQRFKALGRGILLLALAAAGPPAHAQASIIKGPLTFQDAAFADAASMVTGGVGYYNASTLQEALTGDNLASYVTDFDAGERLEIGFTDNWITNDPGPDLAIFEAMLPDEFSVAVFADGHKMASLTEFRPFVPTPIGTIDGLPMNAALVDLSDYGLPAGAVVTWILIRSDASSSAEIAGAAALPEPAALALLGAGAAMLLAGRRRQRCNGTLRGGRPKRSTSKKTSRNRPFPGGGGLTSAATCGIYRVGGCGLCSWIVCPRAMPYGGVFTRARHTRACG